MANVVAFPRRFDVAVVMEVVVHQWAYHSFLDADHARRPVFLWDCAP